MFSLRTALVIQSNDVLCEAGGPDKETGKFCGWIMEDKERWAPLLNTEPIYETAEVAQKAMRDAVATIRAADLSEDIDQLLSIFP